MLVVDHSLTRLLGVGHSGGTGHVLRLVKTGLGGFQVLGRVRNVVADSASWRHSRIGDADSLSLRNSRTRVASYVVSDLMGGPSHSSSSSTKVRSPHLKILVRATIRLGIHQKLSQILVSMLNHGNIALELGNSGTVDLFHMLYLGSGTDLASKSISDLGLAGQLGPLGGDLV